MKFKKVFILIFQIGMIGFILGIIIKHNIYLFLHLKKNIYRRNIISKKMYKHFLFYFKKFYSFFRIGFKFCRS